MEYKGYNLCDASEVLLFDILRELKEIKVLLVTVEKPQKAIPEAKPDTSINAVEPSKKPVEAKDKLTKPKKESTKKTSLKQKA